MLVNVDEINEKKNLLKGRPQEVHRTISVFDALQAGCATIGTVNTNDLPFLRVTEGCSVVELLEGVLAELKKQPELAMPPVKLRSPTAGKVVANEARKGPDDERDWIKADDWKEAVEIVSAATPSGAKIAVAVPRAWNHKCVLLAHGYRNEIQSELINDLAITEQCLAEMLRDNWMVAMSSYRRNGRVVRDAMADMVELREYIVQNHGHLNLCLLEGRSMGGAVVTYLSENYAHLFNGAVAIGAALDVIGDNEEKIAFNYQPEFPILFLTNQSELGRVEAYIDKVKKSVEQQGSTKERDIIVPALWEVWREGHNMVSQAERLSAWKSLVSWVEHGTFITARKQNLFLPSTENIFTVPKPQFVKDKNGKILKTKGEVLNIHPVWRTFYINFVSETMAEAGVKQGKMFKLTVTRTGKSIDVLYTTFPFLCARDTWISFDHPDNVLVLEQFTYDYRDHASLAGVIVGDEVEIVASIK